MGAGRAAAPHGTGRGRAGAAIASEAVSAELDVEAMIGRFQARAKAVRQRGIPPVEGVERKRFVDQARIDFQDYAMIGDAEATLEDGILTLRIDLRPQADGDRPKGS